MMELEVASEYGLQMIGTNVVVHAIFEEFPLQPVIDLSQRVLSKKEKIRFIPGDQHLHSQEHRSEWQYLTYPPRCLTVRQ